MIDRATSREGVAPGPFLALRRSDARAAEPPLSRAAMPVANGVPAPTAPGDGGALVEAAVALWGEGDFAERWAAAIAALRSTWPVRRATLLGPGGGWELREGEARPRCLAPGDVGEDVPAHFPRPGTVDLRPASGPTWALVAPVPPVFTLYVETGADPAGPGALGLETVLRLARLLACHVPPPATAPEETEAAFPGIVGRCPALKELFGTMSRVAPSDVSLHIFGETGTGKEKVARALHLRSARARGPFLPLNASSMSDDLFEAEMFGHVRGAFTGAVGDRAGHVAEADGGTLFIDEVAELSLRAQARLLRFLQEGEYRRVGESTLRRADVRVLTAANVDLEQRVASGRFREDLLYRINVVTLRLPPLRERGDDVLLLARHFLRAAAERVGLPTPRLPSELATALVACPWPGNVRQLENEMSRLVTLAGSGPLRLEHLSPRVGGAKAPPRGSLKQALQAFERDHVGRVLARNGGHRSRTAGELGITRQALGGKIRRLGL